MSADILFSRQKHIGLITLNRPQALNALTLPMVRLIHQQLKTWQDDVDIHAVVIRSAGGKAFCAGGDVRWLYESGLQHSPEQMSFFEEEYRLNQCIHHFPKPYIALMDGVTMGGGVGISLHGSHPVASTAFVFAMPETSIGFFPDIGASFLLSKCPGKMGAYLGLTGKRLQADEALAVGLVKHVIQASALDDVMYELCRADLSVDADARVSACLTPFSERIHSQSMFGLQTHVDTCFGFLDMGSIVNTLAQYSDAWHQETLRTLEQKSPLSLCVTLAQLSKAAQLNFDECIAMDFCLAQHFMADHDFYEGVRALLIDKDKSPQWIPNTLSQVKNSQINQYFTLL